MVTDGNRSQANYEMVTDLVTADPQVWWNMWIPSCIDTVQGELDWGNSIHALRLYYF